MGFFNFGGVGEGGQTDTLVILDEKDMLVDRMSKDVLVDRLSI